MIAVLAGCLIYPSAEINLPPIVLDGTASCGPAAEGGDLWTLNAIVDDDYGPYEVVAVDGWLWDAATGEDLLQLPLYPTTDPFFWSSGWIVDEADVVCGDVDLFVDLVVWDSWGMSSFVTLGEATSTPTVE